MPFPYTKRLWSWLWANGLFVNVHLSVQFQAMVLYWVSGLLSKKSVRIIQKRQYIMKSLAAVKLLTESRRSRFFHLEDVYISHEFKISDCCEKMSFELNKRNYKKKGRYSNLSKIKYCRTTKNGGNNVWCSNLIWFDVNRKIKTKFIFVRINGTRFCPQEIFAGWRSHRIHDRNLYYDSISGTI